MRGVESFFVPRRRFVRFVRRDWKYRGVWQIVIMNQMRRIQSIDGVSVLKAVSCVATVVYGRSLSYTEEIEDGGPVASRDLGAMTELFVPG